MAAREEPNARMPRNMVGRIHVSFSWVEKPKPMRPVMVRMRIGMVVRRWVAGVWWVLLLLLDRLDKQQVARVVILGAARVPRVPPMKGER